MSRIGSQPIAVGTMATWVFEVGRVLLLAAVLACGTGLRESHAQGFDPSVSHITPFPEKDVYRTYVLGDAMADGIAVGLADALREEKSIEFFKKTKSGSGFTRPDVQDWAAIVKDTSAKEKFHIAIIIMGVADRRPILTGSEKKRPLLVGSDEWKQEYGRRIDEFLKAFRRSSAAIYWVGLPVMKVAGASDDIQMINGIIREKVSVHGGKFIDTWNGFTDVNGQYSQTGPDISGKPKALRDNDGVHFTKDGYRKLAHFVERELRRDLAIAKAERNVPLAGSESEQRRVAASHSAGGTAIQGTTPSGTQGAIPTVSGSGHVVAAASRFNSQTAKESSEPAAEAAPQDQKADTTRVSFTPGFTGNGKGETIVLDIVRPAIPSQVIGHVTRNVSAKKSAPVGENVTNPLSDGLVTMSSVTTVTEIAGAARRSVPVTQTPHYKVLVRGDAMPPKPGRADDFRWPRDPGLW